MKYGTLRRTYRKFYPYKNLYCINGLSIYKELFILEIMRDDTLPFIYYPKIDKRFCLDNIDWGGDITYLKAGGLEDIIEFFTIKTNL